MTQGVSFPEDAHIVNYDKDVSSDFIDEEVRVEPNLLDTSGNDELGVEYPNIPEIGQMGNNAPKFWKALIPNVKAMMTSNDLGKAEIFQNSLKDDPKWGGVFQDKFGLPIILWNGLPYYVNKPGFSGTDISTFMGEILKYLPATKYAAGATGVMGTIARGVPAYGTTELISEATSSYVTPKTVAAQERSIGQIGMDVGAMTGIGVGADVILPPAVKYTGKAIGYGAKAVGLDKLGRKIMEIALPRFDPSVMGGPLAREIIGGTPEQKIKQESKYPLTQGQRTGEPPLGVTPKQTGQLSEEDILRHSASDDLGTTIIRGFDENQLGKIRSDALQLQDEFGSGLAQTMDIPGNVPIQAAEEAQNIIIREAERLQGEAGVAYEAVKNVARPPRMTREGVVTIAEDMLRIIPDFFAPSQIVAGPLAREMIQLKKLVKLAKNPAFKDQSLKNIHGYQKRLNTAIKQAERGSPEEAALVKMKQLLDKSVYDGIEKGFIYGDQEVIDQLRNATGLYADFMRLTGKLEGRNGAQRAANKVLEKLSNNDYTPLQVTNLLFGHNKFTPNQAMPLVIGRLRQSLPDSEYLKIEALLKDGILAKAFGGKGGEVTRTAIINNFNDIFTNQKAIIKELFTPAEIKRIEEFRKNVLPTLWAEIKLNPSGTGYTMLGALARQQILSHPILRVAGEGLVKGVDKSKQASKAIDAVRQTVARFQTPLLSNTAQAILRPKFRTESSMDELDPIKDSHLENLRNRLEEASNQPTFELDESIGTQNIPSYSPPVNQNITSMNMPRPDPNLSMSPTIVPDPRDRELAMRQSGIAGLI